MPIRRTPSAGWRTLLLLAAVALLALPVDLRAGTPFAHPHALLALLADAADGTIDHDHEAADEGLFWHDHTLHVAGTGAASMGDVFDVAFADEPTVAAPARPAASSAAAPNATRNVSPDVPTLGAAGPGVGGGAVLLLVAMALPFVRETERRISRPAPAALRGRVVRPTLPPPRPA